MNDDPRSKNSLDFLREIVADGASRVERRSAEPAQRWWRIRKRIWIPPLLLLFAIAGYYSFWFEQKSEWKAEQRALSTLNKAGLSFKTRRVLPEWLAGDYGVRVVSGEYYPPVTFPQSRAEPFGAVWVRYANGIADRHVNDGTEISREEIERLKRRFPYLEEFTDGRFDWHNDEP